MVREIKFIAYLLVCAVAGLAQEVPEGNGGADNALFSQLGYPNVGDIPILNRKVFRGMRVSVMEHPYVVSVRRLRCHYLVGALVTANVVVTVAHPLHNVPTQELCVVAGENYADRGESCLTVLAVVIHQDFDPYTLLADLAIIRLYENVVMKTHQKTIPIFGPREELGKANWEYKAYVTGWGRCDWTGRELCWPRSSIYHTDEKLDPMLRTVTFKYVDPERNVYCKSYENHKVPIREGMLCAGPARQAEPLAPCLAVPGAPLVVLGQLVGLQSWGLGCGFTQDLPLIYTDLQHYIGWLINNLSILSQVNRSAIFELYRATRASVVREWLVRTRVSAATRAPRPGALGPSAVDRAFIALRGTVTDFRDFIDDGRCRAAKLEMYQSLRDKANQLIAIKEIHDNLTTPQTHPFFATKMLEEDADYGFNETNQPEFAGEFFTKSDFFTSRSTSGTSDEDIGEHE